MRYMPAMDGLRAIAVLMVIGFHSRVPGFEGGFIGVDIFFVLSGYLISRVLTENPDLARFYVRRARRLIPALALMLTAYVAIAPFIDPTYPHARDTLLSFFYLSDYAVAFWDIPKYLRHTWSLSVEEHFYLLWPLIFVRWRPGVRALLIAYLVATAWRWNWTGFLEAYSRFDTRLSGLLLGCVIAQLRIRYTFPAWPALVVLAAACENYWWGGVAIQGIGFTIVELASAVAILGTPPKWLANGVLVYLGKVSYGIYLWHYPIARFMREADASWQMNLAATLIGSVVLAVVSYHTIEAIFRSEPKREPAPAT